MSSDVAIAVGNPRRVKATGPIKLSIDAKEVDDAASAVGLHNVNSKLLESHSRLGRYVEQIGAVAVSRGMYLMSAEQAQMAAEEAGKQAEAAPDMESKLGFFKVQGVFMKLFQDAADGLAAASKEVTIQKAGPPPPPPPGLIVNASHVTISEQSTK